MGRPGGGGFASQQGQHAGLLQHATIDQLDVVDQHALFLDALRERRHRAWRGAADVRVVAAAADVEGRRAGITIRLIRRTERGKIDRRDHGDVGQMGAAVVGVVQHEHVARAHRPRVLPDHCLDAFAHRTQVNRHVRRIGDQVALCIEQCAAEIEALLDVDRVGCVL